MLEQTDEVLKHKHLNQKVLDNLSSNTTNIIVTSQQAQQAHGMETRARSKTSIYFFSE